jgi:hypothetical protein
VRGRLQQVGNEGDEIASPSKAARNDRRRTHPLPLFLEGSLRTHPTNLPLLKRLFDNAQNYYLPLDGGDRERVKVVDI